MCRCRIGFYCGCWAVLDHYKVQFEGWNTAGFEVKDIRLRTDYLVHLCNLVQKLVVLMEA